MNEPAYPFRNSADRMTFVFQSVSRYRTITKQVLYDPIDDPFYNLALVDVMPDGRLADDITSDNQDLSKIIATVVQTMLLFAEKYPDKLIYFQGSNDVRTRFYRILIGRELEQATRLFFVYGKKSSDEYEIFVPNYPYIGFAFGLKQ